MYAPPVGNEAPSTPSPAVINNAPPLSGPHIISNVPAQGSTVEGMLLPDTAVPPPPDAPLLPAEGTPPS